MTRKELIERKATEIRSTISISQRWSIILFILAFLSIIISVFPFIMISEEFLKFGLSSMTTLSGAALQGVRYIRRNKLIELEYSKDKVDNYENLKDFDKIIVDKALA
ncbi:hypothetical protein ACFLSS_01700 [Bacteroidota bacterium]